MASSRWYNRLYGCVVVYPLHQWCCLPSLLPWMLSSAMAHGACRPPPHQQVLIQHHFCMLGLGKWWGDSLPLGVEHCSHHHLLQLLRRLQGRSNYCLLLGSRWRHLGLQILRKISSSSSHCLLLESSRRRSVVGLMLLLLLLLEALLSAERLLQLPCQ